MRGADELASFFRARGAVDVALHGVVGGEADLIRRAVRLAGLDIVALDAGPSLVVTADAEVMGGTVRCLKDEVDAAAPEARTVVVIRRHGPVPLAPTLDAYLEVAMTPGRDFWLEDV